MTGLTAFRGEEGRPVGSDDGRGPREADARRARGAVAGAVGGRRHLPLRRSQVPGPGVQHRHAAPHGERLAAHGLGVRLRPDRLHRAVQADGRRRGLLPDGLGRQRPADRASGRALLRRPLRPLTPPRPVVLAAGEAGPEAPGAVLPAELRRAVPAAHRRGRAGVRGAVAPGRPERRLVADLHDDRGDGPAGEPAGLPPQPGQGRGVRSRGADPVGRDRPDRRGPGRARGQGAPRGLPPLRLPAHRRWRGRGHRDDPPRAPPRLRRPRVPSRRRALRAPGREHRHLPPVRRRGPRAHPRAGPAGQGHRHRHGVHLRRPDRRHLVARARPPGPQHPRAQRQAASRGPGGDHERRRPRGVRRARRQDDEAGPGPHRRAAPGGRRARRRTTPHHPPGEVLRAG